MTTSPASTGLWAPTSASATAAACPRPLIQFFVLPPGGVWTLAQAYSTAATASWKTDRQNRRLVPILGLDHGRQ
ncbi:MAG TPA: hypothetical protein VGA47_12110 [Candidatus Dormibacteraeota bacterium]